MLAGIFILEGLDAFQNPEGRAKVAHPFVERMSGAVPMMPADPVQAVRANAITQVVAGTALALGILPRLSALALAASIVPTTIGGHRFWEEQEPQLSRQHRIHFLKNAAILGGLLNEALG